VAETKNDYTIYPTNQLKDQWANLLSLKYPYKSKSLAPTAFFVVKEQANE
jgi:hypothetical protein